MDSQDIRSPAILAAVLLAAPAADPVTLDDMAGKIAAFRVLVAARDEAVRCGAASFSVETRRTHDDANCVGLSLSLQMPSGGRSLCALGADRCGIRTGLVAEDTIEWFDERWSFRLIVMFASGRRLASSLDDHALCQEVFGSPVLALGEALQDRAALASQDHAKSSARRRP